MSGLISLVAWVVMLQLHTTVCALFFVTISFEYAKRIFIFIFASLPTSISVLYASRL